MMTPKSRRDALAWLFVTAVAVLFMIFLVIFMVFTTSSFGNVIPVPLIICTATVPLMAFIVLEILTRAVLASLYRRREEPDAPPMDPFMMWLQTIFSRRD